MQIGGWVVSFDVGHGYLMIEGTDQHQLTSGKLLRKTLVSM